MDTLPSDLLIKIAEATPQPDVTLCRLCRLNKRTRELITPIRLTATVAKQLQQRPLSPSASQIVKLILNECAKKIQAQREAEKDGKPLTTLALNSVSLEQHMLKNVKQELTNARRYVSRMPMPRPPPSRMPANWQPRQPQPTALPPPAQPELVQSFQGLPFEVPSED